MSLMRPHVARLQSVTGPDLIDAQDGKLVDDSVAPTAARAGETVLQARAQRVKNRVALRRVDLRCQPSAVSNSPSKNQHPTGRIVGAAKAPGRSQKQSVKPKYNSAETPSRACVTRSLNLLRCGGVWSGFSAGRFKDFEGITLFFYSVAKGDSSTRVHTTRHSSTLQGVKTGVYGSVLIDKIWSLDDLCQIRSVHSAVGHPGQSPRVATQQLAEVALARFKCRWDARESRQHRSRRATIQMPDTKGSGGRSEVKRTRAN